MNKRNLEDYKFGEAYYGKIPKEQAEKMALLWGEGSESLTNLIEYCILNDIGTFASCKGHGEWAQGYIGFIRMPKEFFKYLMNYMQKNRFERDTMYDISRFGDHNPRLLISFIDSTDNREERFKKILEGIEEYKKSKDNLNLSGIDEIFEETVDFIFSKKGFGKSRVISANGEAKPYKEMPEYTVDPESGIEYAYSPIRRFCRSSKKTLSSILDVPRKIKEQILIKGRQKENEERK